jgi:integrase
LLSPELAAGIRRVKGVRRIGVRLGNWLTADQGRSLLLKSQGDSLRSKRNHAILTLLIGCGLRRGEVLALTVSSIQLREEHWVIADLHGKAGHIRTVPIPLWVKEAIDRWTEASGIKDGCLFRAINKSGQIWGQGMTPKVLWEIVKKAAEAAGIDKLAPQTYGAHVLASVIWPAVNSIRSSSCSGMCPSPQPSTTSAVSRSCESP